MNFRHTQKMRKLATIAVIALLVAQTIAAAHFHPVSSRQQVSASNATGLGDSSCAICATHLHSPATFVGGPTLDTPTVLEGWVVVAVSGGPLSVYPSQYFGRAPPASV